MISCTGFAQFKTIIFGGTYIDLWVPIWIDVSQVGDILRESSASWKNQIEFISFTLIS